MVIAQTLLIAFAILVALYYFGWGVTRFLLPREWRTYEFLSAPFVGYALIVTFDYISLYFNLNLTSATVALVILATLINAFAFLKSRATNERIWIARWRHSFTLALAGTQVPGFV